MTSQRVLAGNSCQAVLETQGYMRRCRAGGVTEDHRVIEYRSPHMGHQAEPHTGNASRIADSAFRVPLAYTLSGFTVF